MISTDVIVAAFDAGVQIREVEDQINGTHTMIIFFGAIDICELFVLPDGMYRWKRNISIDHRHLSIIPPTYDETDLPWLFHHLRSLYL